MSAVAPIPTGWTVESLDDVTVKIQDGTHFSPRPGGTDFKYITSRNIGSGRLRLDSVETISQGEHQKIYRRCDVRFGDLLLTKDGANTGNAALSTFREEVSLLSSVAFIRANPRKAVEGYILQYLLSEPGKRQISDAMAGNAITRLTLAKIRALRVPLPPVSEQRAVASVLADVDHLITMLERLIEKKQAIKQGMMQQLLTGQTRVSGFTDPWSKTSLGAISAFITKGSTPTTYGFMWESTGVPFLRSECVSEHGLDMARSMFISTAANEALRRSRVTDGDILMTITGNVGRVIRLSGIGDANINQHIARVRIKDRRFDDGFVYHYLSQRRMREYFESIVTGQAYPQISLKQVRDTEIPGPPIEEQRAIASALGDLDGELTALRARLEKARAVKIGMMQELLAGRTRLPIAETAA